MAIARNDAVTNPISHLGLLPSSMKPPCDARSLPQPAVTAKRTHAACRCYPPIPGRSRKNPRGYRAMIARRTVLLSAAITAALGLAACHKKDEAPAADPKAVAAAQTVIASPAWLRQHLPAQTVAYLR